jgi:hypothetical protein
MDDAELCYDQPVQQSKTTFSTDPTADQQQIVD